MALVADLSGGAEVAETRTFQVVPPAAPGALAIDRREPGAVRVRSQLRQRLRWQRNRLGRMPATLVPSYDGEAPETVSVAVTLGGVDATPVVYDATGALAEGIPYRLAVPVDASSLPSGRYDWTMAITENYSDDHRLEISASGQQDVLNWNPAPTAPAGGWRAWTGWRST